VPEKKSNGLEKKVEWANVEGVQAKRIVSGTKMVERP
jgi:hypothetical protein